MEINELRSENKIRMTFYEFFEFLARLVYFLNIPQFFLNEYDEIHDEYLKFVLKFESLMIYIH